MHATQRKEGRCTDLRKNSEKICCVALTGWWWVYTSCNTKGPSCFCSWGCPKLEWKSQADSQHKLESLHTPGHWLPLKVSEPLGWATFPLIGTENALAHSLFISWCCGPSCTVISPHNHCLQHFLSSNTKYYLNESIQKSQELAIVGLIL